MSSSFSKTSSGSRLTSLSRNKRKHRKRRPKRQPRPNENNLAQMYKLKLPRTLSVRLTRRTSKTLETSSHLRCHSSKVTVTVKKVRNQTPSATTLTKIRYTQKRIEVAINYQFKMMAINLILEIKVCKKIQTTLKLRHIPSSPVSSIPQ